MALGLPTRAVPARRARRATWSRTSRGSAAMSIAAHPGSAEAASCGGRDWTSPFDGLEWLNGDSEWRDEPWSTLRARSADVSVPAGRRRWRRCSIGPTTSLRRWDALTRSAPRRRAWPARTRTRASACERASRTSSGAHAAVCPATSRCSARSRSPLTGVTLTRRCGGRCAARPRGDPQRARLFDRSTRWRRRRRCRSRRAPRRCNLDGRGRRPAGRWRHRAAGRAATRPPRRRIVADQGRADRRDDRRSPVRNWSCPATRAVYRVEIQLPGAPGEPPVPWIVSNPIYVAQWRRPSRTRAATPHRVAAQYENGPAHGLADRERVRDRAAALDVVPDGRRNAAARCATRSAGRGPSRRIAALAMPAGDALPASRSADVHGARRSSDAPVGAAARPRGRAASGGTGRCYLDETPRDDHRVLRRHAAARADDRERRLPLGRGSGRPVRRRHRQHRAREHGAVLD